jgi:amidohydrolase
MLHVMQLSVVAKMLEVRRHIHEYPELSNQEFETTALISRELRAAGITEIETIGETGVVATVRGKTDGKTVALRADMDALPLTEQSDVAFRSASPGIMHACGHDAHTAILVGVALSLNAMNDFAGNVKCIFQPAEEYEPLGARKVIAKGFLQGVGAIMALHVDPRITVGQIGLRSGTLMACSDQFSITIMGRSSHGAFPHLGVDAITVAATVVQELQKIPSRRIDPLAPVLITIGRISGGSGPNIIANEVVLEGIVRTLDEELRESVRGMIEQVVAGVCQAHGAKASIDVIRGEPVLRNDTATIRLIRESVEEVLGADGVYEIGQPELVGEDFAFYLEHVPGAMIRLGVRSEQKGCISPLHSPTFKLDEDAIQIGASILLQSSLNYLRNPGPEIIGVRRG